MTHPIDFLFTNEIRPEAHDCKLSQDSSCEGCELIAEILHSFNQ